MRISRLAVLVAAALAATGATMLVARAGGDRTTDGTIHACAKQHGGRLRAVAANVPCHHDEYSLDWNVQGPKGDAGPQGAAGGPRLAGAPRAARACRGARD